MKLSLPFLFLATLVLDWIANPLLAQTTILHYTETTGFDHGTRDESLTMFESFGAQHNFSVIDDSDGSQFTKTTLGNVAAVVFSNTSGNTGLNADQRAALEWFVDTLGGSLMGIHAASDTYRHSSANGGDTGSWDWYAETMGGSVQQDPYHTSQNHVDTIYKESDHPIIENLSFPWVKEEEYYYWEQGYLADDLEHLIRVGETGNESYDASRPVGWYRLTSNGSRIFYTSLGHKTTNYTGGFPQFEMLIEDALLWLLEEECVLSDTTTASICEGETFTFQGDELSESGTYTVVVQGEGGCDTTYVCILTVAPTTEQFFSETICDGETIDWQGATLSEAGLFSDTLTAQNGCDSILVLDLEVELAGIFFQMAYLCEGEQVVYGDSVIHTPGEYSFEEISMNGCTTEVVLTVEEGGLPPILIDQSGDTLAGPAGNFAYQWLDCEKAFEGIAGATNAYFLPPNSGQYALLISDLLSGCSDTSTCVELVVSSLPAPPGDKSLRIYPNPVTDWLTIQFEGDRAMRKIEIFNISGKLVWKGKTEERNGIQVQVSDWTPGRYFGRVIDERGRPYRISFAVE